MSSNNYYPRMDYQQIFEHDTAGFLPSPLDASANDYLAHARSTTAQGSFDEIPEALQEDLEEAAHFLKTYSPSLNIVVSKKNLQLWEPACCWIEESEGHVFTATIQCHPSLLSTQRSPRLLSRRILLLHEYIHALRARIVSEKYEEFVAYALSLMWCCNRTDRARCLLGPLFSSPTETFCFLGAFLALYGMLLCSISPLFAFMTSFAALSLPFLLRLYIRWRRIFSVCEYLKNSMKDGSDLPSLLLRLSDSDIDFFAHAPPTSTPKDWRWNYYSLHYGLDQQKVT